MLISAQLYGLTYKVDEGASLGNFEPGVTLVEVKGFSDYNYHLYGWHLMVSESVSERVRG